MTKQEAINELTRCAEICPTTKLAEACRMGALALRIETLRSDCTTCRYKDRMPRVYPCSECEEKYSDTPSMNDETIVFNCIANCEVSSYSIPYPPDRVVVSTGEIANTYSWSKYRVRKAIKGLVEKGMIERASCGCPAVESCGEYRELIYDAMPPKNGYAITKSGFKSKDWKDIYAMWEKSMKEWGDRMNREDGEQHD